MTEPEVQLDPEDEGGPDFPDTPGEDYPTPEDDSGEIGEPDVSDDDEEPDVSDIEEDDSDLPDPDQAEG
jgi:hypothetical protein